MRLLLDTNAFSALKNDHPRVVERVKGSQGILLSVIVLGELVHGFLLGNRYEQNWSEMERFLARPEVTLLPVTQTTAMHYGRIHAELQRKGRPIPVNDMWIAAHAREKGVELISFDRHFREIDGLDLFDPSA